MEEAVVEVVGAEEDKSNYNKGKVSIDRVLKMASDRTEKKSERNDNQNT